MTAGLGSRAGGSFTSWHLRLGGSITLLVNHSKMWCFFFFSKNVSEEAQKDTDTHEGYFSLFCKRGKSEASD